MAPRTALTDRRNGVATRDVLRRHERQVWFLAEHVVDLTLVGV